MSAGTDYGREGSSRSRVKPVHRELHLFAVAVERCRKVLQETGEAEERFRERWRSETNPRFPFAVFAAIRHFKMNARKSHEEVSGSGCQHSRGSA